MCLCVCVSKVNQSINQSIKVICNARNVVHKLESGYSSSQHALPIWELTCHMGNWEYTVL